MARCVRWRGIWQQTLSTLIMLAPQHRLWETRTAFFFPGHTTPAADLQLALPRPRPLWRLGAGPWSALKIGSWSFLMSCRQAHSGFFAALCWKRASNRSCARWCPRGSPLSSQAKPLWGQNARRDLLGRVSRAWITQKISAT